MARSLPKIVAAIGFAVIWRTVSLRHTENRDERAWDKASGAPATGVTSL
jgi:hypothetical protein